MRWERVAFGAALLCLLLHVAAAFQPAGPAGWMHLGPSGGVIEAVAGMRDRLYVGDRETLRVAGDGGWRALFRFPPGETIRSLLPDEARGALWIGTTVGLYRMRIGEGGPPVRVRLGGPVRFLASASSDGWVEAGLGATWWRFAPQGDAARIVARAPAPIEAVAPLPSGGFLVGTAAGPYRFLSLPSGRHAVPAGEGWHAVGSVLAGRLVHDVAVAADGYLAAVGGADGGLYRFDPDAAGDWERSTSLTDYAHRLIGDGSRFFAGLGGLDDGKRVAGVLASEDGGRSWVALGGPVSNSHVYALLAYGDGFLAGTNGGGLYRYLPPRPLDPLRPLVYAVTGWLLPPLTGLGLLFSVLALTHTGNRPPRSRSTTSRYPPRSRRGPEFGPGIRGRG